MFVATTDLRSKNGLLHKESKNSNLTILDLFLQGQFYYGCVGFSSMEAVLSYLVKERMELLKS